jgi:hypothetical protein
VGGFCGGVGTGETITRGYNELALLFG